jgi:hypothetical protein
MAYAQECVPKSLSHEDRIRMERLTFEIAERVHEIARLLARTLEVSEALPVKTFTLTTDRRTRPPAADEPPYVTHEVTFADGSKGCHDFGSSVSCTGPCPCGCKRCGYPVAGSA